MKYMFIPLACLIVLISFWACEDTDISENVDNSTIVFNGTGPLAMQVDQEADASDKFDANERGHEIIDGISEIVKGKITKRVFPDYYGGEYVDDDNNLVVLIKGDINEGREKIRQVVKDERIIRYKECKYSYQEMTDVIDIITDKFDKMPENVKDNLSIYCIYDKENKIVVGLKKCDHKAIEDFCKNVINHPSIEFSQHDRLSFEKPKPEPIKTVIIRREMYPGGYVSDGRLDSSYSGSWAFRARYIDDTTRVGMVTAAHVLSTDSAYIDGVYVGSQEVPILTDEIDASFVVVPSHLPPWHYITPDNFLSIEYSGGLYPNYENEMGELSSTLYSPVVGTPVNKRGWCTGRTFGYVNSTNFCAIVQNISTHLQRPISNMIYASLTSDHGDSGGIVYTYFSSTNKRCITGIVCSKDSTVGTRITKAELAIQALGIETY